jgi:uncharacterized protein YeaO (DUF488 family)
MLKIKRVYDEKSTEDGERIYVDRIWPRGLTKERAAIDEWLKELSPSDDLRKWFGHEPEKFREFKRRYLTELLDPAKQVLLKKVARQAETIDVTLLFSAKDTKYNNAVVLLELIGKIMKKKAPAA